MEDDDVEEEAEEQQPEDPSAIEHLLLIFALTRFARSEDASPHAERGQRKSNDQGVLVSTDYSFLPPQHLGRS